jgi:alkylhydroperoxidase/carboxymuconolactone decarboxylase family protein YurZ
MSCARVTRSMATASSTGVSDRREGETEQVDFPFPNAIKDGVTQEELVEMFTHHAFYVG